MNPKPHKPISDSQIIRLIRMVDEIEKIERSALASRVLVVEPASSGVPSILRFRRWIASAAAAAAAFFIFAVPDSGSTRLEAVEKMSVTVSYHPEIATTECCRRDCVTSTPQRTCSIMALLRRWSSECDCMVWDLYDWEGGETVARVQAGQRVEVIADVEVPATHSDVVLFAVAQKHSDLPAHGREGDLLDCLMKTADEIDPNSTDAMYTAVVETCLPKSVTVIPQRLAAR